MQEISSVFSFLSIFFLCLFALASLPRLIWTICLIRKERRPAPAERKNRYGILICARNEEAVIGRLIDSIAAQDYPAENLKVFVAADNCTDRTAEVARAHGAAVLERQNQDQIGKGYAMEALTEFARKDEFCRDIAGYFVFDADNILDSHFIDRINDYVAAGYSLCKGFRSTVNFTDGFLSESYGIYFMTECGIFDRGRARMGSTTLVTGTGFFIARSILERENGWHYFTLSEDTELTFDQYLKGETVGYCHDAIFYDEQPTDFSTSVRQRKRWIKGTMQAFCRYAGGLFRALFSRRFPSAYDLIAQTGMMYILTGCATIVTLLDFFWKLAVNPLEALTGLISYFASLYFGSFLLALVTAIGCRRRIPLSRGRLFLAMLRYPFFMMTFIPITLGVMFGAKVEWKPIPHGGGTVSLPDEQA